MGVKELFRLDGRTALITGGSRGLGLQMAEALGEMGCLYGVAGQVAPAGLQQRNQHPQNLQGGFEAATAHAHHTGLFPLGSDGPFLDVLGR